MRRLAILGSTGSIGQQTLDVVGHHPAVLEVIALAAYRRVDILIEQCQQFRPRYVAVVDETSATQLQQLLLQRGLTHIEVLKGAEGLQAVATLEIIDTVMAGIVGASGLLSTLAAVKAGKRVLLANKEALVMAGPLLMREMKHTGAELLPVDSEHNAVFQCLGRPYKVGNTPQGVERIILTASGGPFLKTPLTELATVSITQACTHPRWKMGPKISVDSATLMNKSLELIEAHYLFNLAAEQIDVVIHPQSIVHALVQFMDGSTLAQMGNPDMRTPIAEALGYPERLSTSVKVLDVLSLSNLEFLPVDEQRFSALRLARHALAQNGTAITVLNAANEVAVEAFLAGRIGFTQIVPVIETVLTKQILSHMDSLERVLTADKTARLAAKEIVEGVS